MTHPIHTIGHSTKSIPEFVELLRVGDGLGDEADRGHARPAGLAHHVGHDLVAGVAVDPQVQLLTEIRDSLKQRS